MSLSCKPEWNTLLQSAKLAVEGRRMESKVNEGGGERDRNENGNGKESCGLWVPREGRDEGKRNTSLESRATKRIKSPYPIPFSDTMHKDCGGNLQQQKGAGVDLPSITPHAAAAAALPCRQQKWKPIFAVWCGGHATCC